MVIVISSATAGLKIKWQLEDTELVVPQLIHSFQYLEQGPLEAEVTMETLPRHLLFICFWCWGSNLRTQAC